MRASGFHPDLFTDVVRVDWIGIGGSGGSSFVDSDLQDPEPDDCMDDDEEAVVWGNAHLAFPSVAFKIIQQEETTIVPGQSVEAPPELIALCNTIRENLNGQDPDYQYASDPQRVGIGNVTNEASTFVLGPGNFLGNDTFGNGTALPLTFAGRVCHITGFSGTSSAGNENLAGQGFPNGVLNPPAAGDSCQDISAAVISFLFDENPNEPSDWDAGWINRMGGVVLWDLDLFADNIGFGLNVFCYHADVVDWSATQFGFFEDYAWFWVDGPANLFGHAPQWSQLTNTDGQAHGQDCSSIGIVV